MEHERQGGRPSSPSDSDGLRAEIRSTQRVALGLGIFAILVSVPMAANWGRGGAPLISAPEGWGWLVGALGTAALMAGLAAVYMGIRVSNLEAKLPRRTTSKAPDSATSAKLRATRNDV
jgi:hypothetical protein